MTEKTFNIYSAANLTDDKRFYVSHFTGVGGVRSTLPNAPASATRSRSVESSALVSSLVKPVIVSRRKPRKRAIADAEAAKLAARGDGDIIDDEEEDPMSAEGGGGAAAAGGPGSRKRSRGPKWKVQQSSGKLRDRAKHIPWNFRDSNEPPMQFEGQLETGQKAQYVLFIEKEKRDEAEVKVENGEKELEKNAANVATATSSSNRETDLIMIPVENWIKFRKRVPPARPISLEDAEEEMRKASKIPDRFSKVLARGQDETAAAAEAAAAKAAEQATMATLPAAALTDWEEAAAPGVDQVAAAAARAANDSNMDTARYEARLAKADEHTAEMFDYQEEFSDDDGDDALAPDALPEQAVVKAELRAAGFASDSDDEVEAGDDDDSTGGGLSKGGRSMKRLLGQFERGEVGLGQEETRDRRLAAQGDEAAQIRLAKKVREEKRPLPPLPKELTRVSVMDVMRARGLITMAELIAHFKPLLRGDGIALFSAVVKEVASGAVFEGQKFVRLRENK